MALAATHIKFALDLKSTYNPQNEAAYISGSIYPDSRYLTKIDRHLTHNLETLNPTTDFEKGWQNHLVCDKIQGLMMNKHLPDEFNSDKNKMKQGNDFWVRRTALKIIQDIEIINSFDIKKLLPLLDYIETPNNESITKMKRYNQLMQKFYVKKQSIDGYCNMWSNWGIEETLIKKIHTATEKNLKQLIYNGRN